MSVQCANCGEQLLGSVNRCWKCGQLLVAHAGPADIPPVRRSPIAGPLNAPPDVAIHAVLIDEAPPIESQNRIPRRGSPFANAAHERRPAAASPSVAARPETVKKRSTSVAPRMAAIASIVLGLIATAVSFAFSPGALLIAVAGICFGIWGLYSENRMLGLCGLVLCCIALALSAFLLSIDLYQYIYGVSPFAPEVLPPDPMIGF